MGRVQGVFASWMSKPLRVAWKTKQTPDYPSENVFKTKSGCVRVVMLAVFFTQPRSYVGVCRDEGKFGSLFDVPSKFLTLVVPAYNEEKRMGVMLDEMMATLAQMEKSRRCVNVGTA